MNYNAALEMLDKHLRNYGGRLTLDLVLRIQKQVTLGLLPLSQSGYLRAEPDVLTDPRTGNVVYIPPAPKDVPKLIADLLIYTDLATQERQMDPLIVAGIFHKQFVLIHPFTDGNGRTTRLSTKILLAALGLNTFNLFSFENYYNLNVTRYFQVVGEVGDYYDLATKADFTAWLEYFTEGIIDELLRVEKLLPRALTPATTLQPYHQIILDIIKEKGFATDRDYATRTTRARATRILDFQKLVDLGMIERQGQRRGTYYILAGQPVVSTNEKAA